MDTTMPMIQPRRLLLWLDVVVLAQSLYYYSKLPPTVASHFDATGRANGWSPRMPFFLIQLVAAALVTAIFLGVPMLFAKVPTSLRGLGVATLMRLFQRAGPG